MALAIFGVVELKYMTSAADVWDVGSDNGSIRHGGVVSTPSTHYCYSLVIVPLCLTTACWLNLLCCCDRSIHCIGVLCCWVSSALLHLAQVLLFLKTEHKVITIHTRACSIGVW